MMNHFIEIIMNKIEKKKAVDINKLGENEKLPINLSIWLPHILMFILITIGLVRINEK